MSMGKCISSVAAKQALLAMLRNFGVWLAISIIWPAAAKAGIVAYGSRVIIGQGEASVVFQVRNDGLRALLLQGWINDASNDVSPEQANVPFILTPPLRRIEPREELSLTIRMMKEHALPSDRESLFWINLAGIPRVASSPEKDQLVMMTRSRFKLLYRPRQLPGSTQSAATAMCWSVAAGIHGVRLIAENSAAFHVHLAAISMINHEGQSVILESGYIRPFDARSFQVPNHDFGSLDGSRVEYEWIDDWGASNKHHAYIGNCHHQTRPD